MRTTGDSAIAAKEDDPTIVINKYADPTEDAREDITLDDAREIAAEDPGLIYCV